MTSIVITQRDPGDGRRRGGAPQQPEGVEEVALEALPEMVTELFESIPNPTGPARRAEVILKEIGGKDGIKLLVHHHQSPAGASSAGPPRVPLRPLGHHISQPVSISVLASSTLNPVSPESRKICRPYPQPTIHPQRRSPAPDHVWGQTANSILPTVIKPDGVSKREVDEAASPKSTKAPPVVSSGLCKSPIASAPALAMLPLLKMQPAAVKEFFADPMGMMVDSEDGDLIGSSPSTDSFDDLDCLTDLLAVGASGPDLSSNGTPQNPDDDDMEELKLESIDTFYTEVSERQEPQLSLQQGFPNHPQQQHNIQTQVQQPPYHHMLQHQPQEQLQNATYQLGSSSNQGYKTLARSHQLQSEQLELLDIQHQLQQGQESELELELDRDRQDQQQEQPHHIRQQQQQQQQHLVIQELQNHQDSSSYCSWESGSSSSSSGGSHFEFSCNQDLSDMMSDFGMSEMDWGTVDMIKI